MLRGTGWAAGFAAAAAAGCGRAMPGEPLESAVSQIKSWNLHVFAMRRPPGLMLGSDVIFVEPPVSNG